MKINAKIAISLIIISISLALYANVLIQPKLLTSEINFSISGSKNCSTFYLKNDIFHSNIIKVELTKSLNSNEYSNKTLGNFTILNNHTNVTYIKNFIFESGFNPVEPYKKVHGFSKLYFDFELIPGDYIILISAVYLDENEIRINQTVPGFSYQIYSSFPFTKVNQTINIGGIIESFSYIICPILFIIGLFILRKEFSFIGIGRRVRKENQRDSYSIRGFYGRI